LDFVLFGDLPRFFEPRQVIVCIHCFANVVKEIMTDGAGKRVPNKPSSLSGRSLSCEGKGNVSNPSVEIFPANVVRRHAITGDGMTAESIQCAGGASIEYHFSGAIDLLVIYVRGARCRGETWVEGMPRTALASFARKLTFVPAGREYYECHELRKPSCLVFLYLEPKKLKSLPDTRFTDALSTPDYFLRMTISGTQP
jgi:hypothetical protein